MHLLQAHIVPLQVGLSHRRRDEAERIMAESYSWPRWATSVARPPSGPLKKKKKVKL